ncbi:MAG TPA: PadR family transcriptional regulator [Anaerolineales bacterium]|nr:PadR family transcriptional regulator [Anaerolineales bacterium]
MSQLNDLLLTWESNYKKGLLSFWVLLVLREQPAYARELGALIEQASAGSLTADDNSLYRALNRFEGLDLIRAESRPSDVGPDRRYYRLTAKGVGLLRKFTERNILIFQRHEVQQRLEALFSPAEAAEAV